VIPISLATLFSLLGDTTLYTVLPTHLDEAGILLAQVGILLSANRWIRLPLNGPAGVIYERYPRRWLFPPAILLGAVSTALYALTSGFWPLLVGRLLWGIAWVGIWVGGNTIVLDISNHQNRGRWVGMYQIAFFLGAAGGSLIGGVLTDLIGYHATMGVQAGLTALGFLIVWIWLPETRGLRSLPEPDQGSSTPASQDPPPNRLVRRSRLATAGLLLAINRLTQAGFLITTLSLFLEGQLGREPMLLGRTVGVATLTGVSLGLTTLISTISAPVMGAASDRMASRWRIVSAGLLLGVIGYLVLSTGTYISIPIGLVLVAIASGSNMNLSTTLIGDLSNPDQHSRRLGALFTLGDLASAIGPPVAFAWIASLGLQSLYLLSAGIFSLMLVLSLAWSIFER
jgi:MFS family permease